MKKLWIVATLLFTALACEEDEKIVDSVKEYVSFTGSSSVTVSEVDDARIGYPLVAQLWATRAYSEDITLTVSVSGQNAEEGIDYISPATQFKIKAGKLMSDTIWVKTVNGDIGNDLERTIDVTLIDITKSGIGLGFGTTEPKNKTVTFKISDDECSGNPICIFNQDLINTISHDGGGKVINAASIADKVTNIVTLKGNLIDYAKLSTATLILTLVPTTTDSSTGSVIFDEQQVGTDSDGYDYKFIQTGSGAYDAAAGTITITYGIYYLSSGEWIYWYSVTNDLSVP